MKGNKRPEVGERGREGEERERTRGRRDWDGVARGGGGAGGERGVADRREEEEQLRNKVPGREGRRDRDVERAQKRRKAEGERDKGGEERRLNGRTERVWRGEWDALPERPTCAPPPGSLQAAAHKAAFDARATRAILGMRWGEKAPTHTP